jgi:formylglycine-generating enzyme required for sulfatase activity
MRERMCRTSRRHGEQDHEGVLMSIGHAFSALAFSASLCAAELRAQSHFGGSCAGASGATPTLDVSGIVAAGQTWTLEITAPGGIGFGYLLIGFSNTNASALGGLPLPLDLGVFFARAPWSGCFLNVDPSHSLQPYVFDPNVNGGRAELTFPGWDVGTVHMQAMNLDADFVTRIAGVSQGLTVQRTLPTGMVPVVPGTFAMGSSAPDQAPYFGQATEKPVHTVTIGHGFAIGAHEVTQAEYAARMGSNPSAHLGPNRPVDSVTWFDAQAYCVAVTAAESLAGHLPSGYEYRLPTEAEWEYACRASIITEFNLGSTLFCDDAWIFFSQHSNSFCGIVIDFGTTDVGSFPPNLWGVHDMHGNVSEWCLDSFASYTVGPVTDPFVTGGPARVQRGGGWQSPSFVCRSASRVGNLPSSTNATVGFRVVLAPILVP